MSAKRLSHGTANLVQEHLEGVSAAVPHIRLLDGFPQIKVAFDARHDRQRVALIAGGGSGHEPAFAGFLGEGMVAAVACGDIFAAPSADGVLAAIRAVTGTGGCLLLPLNYTGDRLNFGIAEQRAKAEGFDVGTVLIEDDCAIRDPGTVGRRGLAGSVLVLKLLGAAAKRGASLDTVMRYGREAVANLGTIGVGLETCALPGHTPAESRLQSNEIELGLGIHGEAGVQKMKDLSMSSVVKTMLKSIITYDPSPFDQMSKTGVLVNSLGGMSVMDINSIANRAVQVLQQEHGLKIGFVLAGTFVTSVTVAGFSITLLKMEESYTELLHERTDAPAWTMNYPFSYAPHPKVALPASTEKESISETVTERGAQHRRCVEAVVECLMEKEKVLNEWDAKVGDGDCGSTLVKACEAIREDMDTYPFNDAASLLRSIGGSIGRASGGTSGALYNIFLTSGSLYLETDSGKASGLEQWIKALEHGVQSIKKYGRAEEGDRTMLDALEPARRALKESSEAGMNLQTCLANIQAAAEKGAQSTVDMVARAGRSSYIPIEFLKATPDPGAMAVAFWMQAVANCF